jgi:hypothetical protein
VNSQLRRLLNKRVNAKFKLQPVEIRRAVIKMKVRATDKNLLALGTRVNELTPLLVSGKWSQCSDDQKDVHDQIKHYSVSCGNGKNAKIAPSEFVGEIVGQSQKYA